MSRIVEVLSSHKLICPYLVLYLSLLAQTCMYDVYQTLGLTHSVRSALRVILVIVSSKFMSYVVSSSTNGLQCMYLHWVT